MDHTLKITAEIVLIIFLFFRLHSICIKGSDHTENTTVEIFSHNPLNGGRVRNEVQNPRIKQNV